MWVVRVTAQVCPVVYFSLPCSWSCWHKVVVILLSATMHFHFLSVSRCSYKKSYFSFKIFILSLISGSTVICLRWATLQIICAVFLPAIHSNVDNRKSFYLFVLRMLSAVPFNFVWKFVVRRNFREEVVIIPVTQFKRFLVWIEGESLLSSIVVMNLHSRRWLQQGCM